MIVIADDITGAAEIAGIAFTQRQAVSLLCECPVSGDIIATTGFAATTVIATDTRSMTEAEAVAETRRIASAITFFGGDGGRGEVLPSFGGAGGGFFKKTDSALRGHVVAELTALMQATGYRRAVYMPANPSKGRTIRNGIYYIDGTPIADTAFSYDPEFPARTSSLCECFPDAEAKGIIMPDAESEADIRALVDRYDDGHTLFAGAADLFKAIAPLNPPEGGRNESSKPVLPLSGGLRGWGAFLPPSGGLRGALLVCGSTQSHPDAFGLPVAEMPFSIYDGSDDLTPWLNDALDKYAAGPLVIAITHRHRTGRDVAVRLRRLTAQLVEALFRHHTPSHLYIEGGATAFSVLHTLGISRLTVTAQPAPGVVSMTAPDGLVVTLKPGSYPFRFHHD